MPKDFWAIVAKTELLVPLGSNRKLAERDLHAAVAVMRDRLAAAQAKLDVSAAAAPRKRARPLSVAQIAHPRFAEEMARDTAERDHPDQSAAVDMSRAREGHTDLLRRVAFEPRLATRR